MISFYFIQLYYKFADIFQIDHLFSFYILKTSILLHDIITKIFCHALLVLSKDEGKTMPCEVIAQRVRTPDGQTHLQQYRKKNRNVFSSTPHVQSALVPHGCKLWRQTDLQEHVQDRKGRLQVLHRKTICFLSGAESQSPVHTVTALLRWVADTDVKNMTNTHYSQYCSALPGHWQMRPLSCRTVQTAMRWALVTNSILQDKAHGKFERKRYYSVFMTCLKNVPIRPLSLKKKKVCASGVCQVGHTGRGV